jgi:hypothetical protein
METLMQHGLKEALREFYRQMQKADPQCTVPAFALKRLE